MKKKLLDWALLAVFVALLSCTVQYTYVNIARNDLDMRMGNMFQSQNAVYMHVRGITTGQLTDLFAASNSRFTLFAPQKEENVYGFFSTEKTQPALLSGTHFSKDDLKGKNSIALIGQNLQAQRESGTVTCGGSEYIVSGVMGNSNVNQIDDAVFLNLACVEIDEELPVNLILDSAQKHTLAKLDFARYVDRLGGSVTVLSQDKANITGFADNAIEKDALFVLLLVSYFISAAVILWQWLSRCQKEILVCKTIGIRAHRIYFSIFKRFLLSVLPALILSGLTAVFTDISASVSCLFIACTFLVLSAVFSAFFLKIISSKKRGDRIDSL